MENQKLIIAFDAKRLFNNFTGLGNYSRTLVRNLQTFFPEHEYHLFTPKITNNEETAYFLNNEKFILHTPSFKSPMWRSVGMAAAPGHRGARASGARGQPAGEGPGRRMAGTLGAGLSAVSDPHPVRG